MAPSPTGAETEVLALEASRGWAHEAIRLANATRAGAGLDPVTKSGPFDFATSADRLIESRLRDWIAESFPLHSVLGEEEGGDADSDGWQWILDPVDGTLDFMTGLYGSACSIALRHGRDLRVGAIGDFTTGVVTSARLGGGWSSTAHLPLPGRTAAGRARVFIEWGTEQIAEPEIEDLRAIALARAAVPRLIGGAATALAAVATGGGCFIGLGLRVWDVAAGLVISHEAGLASRVWSGPDSYVDCIVGDQDDIRAFEPAVRRSVARTGRMPSPYRDDPAESATART
jgi:myo-inositol-1(or 4)-monophosphatase